MWPKLQDTAVWSHLLKKTLTGNFIFCAVACTVFETSFQLIRSICSSHFTGTSNSSKLSLSLETKLTKSDTYFFRKKNFHPSQSDKDKYMDQILAKAKEAWQQHLHWDICWKRVKAVLPKIYKYVFKSLKLTGL